MTNQETPLERKNRFKAMTSEGRKALIRAKMRSEHLEEGSGIPGKDLFSYDREEISELLIITRCLAEMKKNINN